MDQRSGKSITNSVEKMVVLITGMHSSGTSIVSRYLHFCGVNMMGDREIDHLGEHFDFRVISHAILKDSNHHRYSNSFDYKTMITSDSTKAKISHAIQNSINGKSHCGFKAPIVSLTLWIWAPEIKKKEEKICIVHVFRNPREVVESFLRRKTLRDLRWIKTASNKKSKEYLEQVWAVYNQSVLDFYDQNKDSYKFAFLYARDFVKNPKMLSNALGIKNGSVTGLLDSSKFIELEKTEFYDKNFRAIWRNLMDKKLK